MQKISILYDASQAVLSTFDLDEVLNQILAIARDYFCLQSGAILLRDDADVLRVRAQFGDDPQMYSTIRVGEGIVGSAARLKRPVCVADVSKDPRYICGTPSTRSELAVPLMLHDEVVGVLDCQSEEVNHFDSEMVDLLTLFSTQASIGLQNAQLYSNEQKRARQLEAINAVAREATAVLDLRELLARVSNLVLKSFPLDHTAIFLREDDGRLVMRAHGGILTPRLMEGDVLAANAGSVAGAMETGQTVVVNDAADFSLCFEETRSEIYLPLLSLGEKIGLLMGYSARSGAFSESDVQALESVADIVATGVQNAGYVERVRQLAYRDGLTGIFNRRLFELRIMEEMERAGRYSGGLSILMVDIDHFKLVNDEFGHLLGDEALRQVAAIFIQQLRKVDIVCRYGGEEFAIIVPATTGANAIAVAEKLRRVVANWQFAGIPRPVTISVGVAEYPQHGKTRDELVRAADAALYLAKQNGRNCVQSAHLNQRTAATPND